MPRQIRTVYVIHHSHTDIGYTDLYSLWLDGEKDPEAAMDALRENCFDPYVLVIE